MGFECAVPSCKNISVNTGGGKRVSYFSFPKDERLKHIWIRKCNGKTSDNYDEEYICSDHFREDDFERDLRGELLNMPIKKKLKPNAIPFLLLGNNDDVGPKTVTDRQKRFERRKRKDYIKDVLDENNTNISGKIKSIPSNDDKLSSPLAKKKKQEDDMNEEELQKILLIVLERIQCLEKELEGLTHIMEDIRGRIEKIQNRS